MAQEYRPVQCNRGKFHFCCGPDYPPLNSRAAAGIIFPFKRINVSDKKPGDRIGFFVQSHTGSSKVVRTFDRNYLLPLIGQSFSTFSAYRFSSNCIQVKQYSFVFHVACFGELLLTVHGAHLRCSTVWSYVVCNVKSVPTILGVMTA